MSDWPAPAHALEAGRAFLRDAARLQRVVVAADRDVDGLSAGMLVQRALEQLGARDVTVVPPRKGEHIHHPAMQARLRAMRPDALVVVDMGSRGAPLLDDVPALLVDHHQPHGLPPGAVVVSAFGHDPVAATALLTWELVKPLTDLRPFDWLALLGTAGDLGTELPFAEMTAALKRYGRKPTTDAIALLNAARRAQDHDTDLALRVLQGASSPADIAGGRVAGVEGLRRARAAVQAELRRCGFAAPKFSGQFVLVRFSSPTQIHPLLAKRWARRLPKYIVFAANDGYLPGRVNFAARTELDVNLVELLRALPLDGAQGEWGFGHPSASGGSLATDDFVRFLRLLGFEAERPALEAPASA